jgi:hypothetical protein
MLKRKSPSHTAKRGTAEVDFGVGLVPMLPISRLVRHMLIIGLISWYVLVESSSVPSSSTKDAKDARSRAHVPH